MIPVPHPVIQSLAEAYRTSADSLSHFGGGQEASDGIVYAYPYRETRRLLKIMAIPSDDQRVGLLCLEERLRFVRFLGEDGARIVYPEFSPQGKLYETCFHENYMWIAYSMEIAPGKPMHEKAWDPDFFRNWGQSIGRLHRLAQQYPTWQALLDPETGKDLLTWRGEWESFHHWIQDEEVKSMWGALKQQLEALPVTRDSFGFIHNDPHIWNLLVDGKRITLLDFDVANHHWFVNDLAIACQNILIFLSGGLNGPVHDRTRLIEFLESFLEGYTLENRLSSEWLARLDLFIAYRRILLFTVMNEWVQSQPKLNASWKQMILSQPVLVGDHFIGIRERSQTRNDP